MGHYSLTSYTTLVFYFRREKGGVGGGLFATYIEPGIEGQKPHLKICSQNTLLESSDCWPADAAVFLAVTRCLLMQARWLYGGKKNSFFFSFSCPEQTEKHQIMGYVVECSFVLLAYQVLNKMDTEKLILFQWSRQSSVISSTAWKNPGWCNKKHHRMVLPKNAAFI